MNHPVNCNAPPAVLTHFVSKYDLFWQHVSDQTSDSLTMIFDAATTVLGFEIDHSLLTCKKELVAYGWSAGKISPKNKIITSLARRIAGRATPGSEVMIYS